MLNTTTLSSNAAMSYETMINALSENVINAVTPGYNGMKLSFKEHMLGGEVDVSGHSWRQGVQLVKPGEPTKMMLRGKGFFSTYNPETNEMLYTRLGDFHFDKSGTLVTADGFMVLGTPLASNVQPKGNTQFDQIGAQYETGVYADPFNNPATRQYNTVDPGTTVGKPQPINLAVDPATGLYLGRYEKVRIDKSGIVWGKYGNSETSLYKMSLRTFHNLDGLKGIKDTYWKETTESGRGLPCNAQVLTEALEKSNVWSKVEIDQLIEAQRMYSAAINTHKISDKLLQQAIELVG